MVKDDDDPYPTVSTLVKAGNEVPGVDDHEPVLGAVDADTERRGTGRGRLFGCEKPGAAFPVRVAQAVYGACISRLGEAFEIGLDPQITTALRCVIVKRFNI